MNKSKSSVLLNSRVNIIIPLTINKLIKYENDNITSLNLITKLSLIKELEIQN